jgi:glycosyltransferase involved in cell wall biosynthesis
MNFSDFKACYQKVPVQDYRSNYTKEPIVTIRLLVYNHAPYLRECLNSILMQQTSFPYLLLISEDASNDGSREICKEYADKYSDKVRLLLHSRENNIMINGKPSGLFNSVYSNFCITSKYIATCEADDYWTDPYSLQKRVEYLESHSDHVICFHNSKKFHQEGQHFEEPLLPFHSSRSFDQSQIINVQVPTASIVYRNHLIDKFDPNMVKVTCGDFILKMKLTVHGKARYIHEIEPSIYRIHGGGTYSRQSKFQKNVLNIQAREYFKQLMADSGVSLSFLNDDLASKYLRLFIKQLKARQINTAMMHGMFIHCLSHFGSFVKASVKFLPITK